VSSCINLKPVNDFSSTSIKSLEKYKDLEITHKFSCEKLYYYRNLSQFNLKITEPNCDFQKKADEANLILYNSVLNYFSGLEKITDDEIVSHNLEKLVETISGENLQDFVNLDDKQKTAFSKLGTLLFRAFTDGYRKEKVKEFVKDADPHIEIIIDALSDNVSKLKLSPLKTIKDSYEQLYSDLTKDSLGSKYDKINAYKEYLDQLRKIRVIEKKVDTYIKSLAKIKEGHKKLASNIDQLKKDQVKNQLIEFTTIIKTITTEINNLK
jgi:hypothetical protein